MTVYVWSDLHLTHNNITKSRTQFATSAEHDEWIVQQYLKVIDKRDKIFLLGDIAIRFAGLNIIKELPGYKHLVLGNHDLERGPRFADLVGIYDKVDSMVKYKNLWLTHAPIHPDELRGKKNVHGHSHGHILNDKRYINVCVEHADKPIPIEEIINGNFETYTRSSNTNITVDGM